MKNDEQTPYSESRLGEFAPAAADLLTELSPTFPFPQRGTVPIRRWPPNCLRASPISGRYEGSMTTNSRSVLDLRVDIDIRYPNSPVMNRISGDIYDQQIIFPWPWRGAGRVVRVYLKSWIVDAPQVTWSGCEVVITGSVRPWQGIHLAEEIRVRIPWTTFGPIGPAEVSFSIFGSVRRSYTCAKVSNCFRDIALEIDVCQSVNAAPIVPSYQTDDHASRPPTLPERTLTIEEAYKEAGFCITINPTRTVIDDTAPQFTSWSSAELHDAMETNFSQFGGTWPAWHLWGLLAGEFDNADVGGIMFDAAATFGGAGELPERQGFAVFRNHQWFNNLVAGPPTNQQQAWAMRQYLYAWIHEAGHAFNLLHSWNKARPDALSWMNYPHNYDNRNPPTPPVDSTFWSRFAFRFDDEELIHMRHGDRPSVIMGGDPWSSGGHLESPSGAMIQMEGDAPIELLLRSKEYFDLMEPVIVEFRLRNLTHVPLEVNTQLNPEYGEVIVYIRRPDGRILEYAPILCKLATAQVRKLRPLSDATKGEDRYSEDVVLSYGTYGFYFDHPGEYFVRAVYQGGGNVLVSSNTHKIRIGTPPSKAEDRIAQEFFTYQIGMSLYLSGSQSPFLSKGMSFLESIADRYKDTLLGAKAATALASSVARPFFRIEDSVLTKTHSADVDKALKVTSPALGVYQRDQNKSLNIAYHQLVRARSDYLIQSGQKAVAKEELGALREDLAARGVNEPVLNEIETYEKSI